MPDDNLNRTTPDQIARGRIVDADTRRGLAELLVTLFHVANEISTIRRDGAAQTLDNAQRLGSVMTDDDGNFGIEYLIPDGGKTPANLVLTVTGPELSDDKEPALLHVSSRPRKSAGPVESFNIKLSSDDLVRIGMAPEPTVAARMTRYKSDWAAEDDLSKEIKDFHKARVATEAAERKVFRDDLIKLAATDVATAAFPGEMATDGAIGSKVDAVTTRGVTQANNAIGEAEGVPVTLFLTDADRSRLRPFLDNAVDGIAEIPEHALGDVLFRNEGSENPGTLLIHQNPIARYCAEQTFEEICAEGHTGLRPDAVATDDDGDDGDGLDGGGDGTGGSSVTDAPLLNEDVPLQAARLLAGVPSPDQALSGDLSAKRLDQKGLEDAVGNFSLRAGPADVPAYYDFQSLQIAFDHVWQVLIDEDMVDAAHSVEKRYKAKTGMSLAARFDLPWTEALSGNDKVYEWVPREVPAVVLAQFDITLPEWVDLNSSYQSKLREIAQELDEGCFEEVTSSSWFNPHDKKTTRVSRRGTMACEKRRQDLREQGERIIDSVRHDDYYTLHRTLRELKQAIDSGYEFTVFAADHTTMAVNFGLLNDFRQEWAPLNYQVGKLIKTIALTPSEERRYSMKVNRNLKHSQKEALKNNSAVSAEQTSTARVEAEIMAKAQNKTEFGLTSEGTYNVGVSKGKATTSFGVEALQESSSARKDFRESVMKAAQEYKDERSVEIDTERTEGSEYTESGLIRNENKELSVTHLFYELQRRYRVSESLHRVQPVVLVAQKVPAPHQITESWVIANDWILNRYLLDDSFRPALIYLRSKSVGDDFALRELRKNLRQQRNLVESLRVEYALASHEAESRYRALEAAVGKRISEEEAEDTDGWFSDIGDFFGGGGQSPEAAKARELAAKDAHQFATERAGKQGVALKQEVRTLHEVTKDYNATLRDHLDNETRVKRLLVHIRKNIFHYMQAIWNMEPPDQRFLRLHKVKVPVIELATVADPQNPGTQVPDRRYAVRVNPEADIFSAFRSPGTTKHRALMTGRLRKSEQTRPLVEVADLDNLLGFKGNYMIFPLKEHNALTEFMAAPYVDAAFGAMDPDELSNVNLRDFSRYICCLHDQLSEEDFVAMKPSLTEWLKKLLADPLRNGEEVVVPTQSLFIEALPGSHPLLEDFKLRHRELDVYAAQNEVRRGGLEALRLAARLINRERDDPDIEKKIVVEGAVPPLIDVDNP